MDDTLKRTIFREPLPKGQLSVKISLRGMNILSVEIVNEKIDAPEYNKFRSNKYSFEKNRCAFISLMHIFDRLHNMLSSDHLCLVNYNWIIDEVSVHEIRNTWSIFLLKGILLILKHSFWLCNWEAKALKSTSINGLQVYSFPMKQTRNKMP